ncbi:MAG: chemotaxis protein CheW [Alphaproteobacteria bacterium]|nr:chemotaxis protein CheW [Alphaproteobacteria bacterium]
MSETANNREAWARELVAFRIGDQDFCVDIMSVREIRGWTPATPIPHAPSFVKGVINLRGTVLPIIDLAHRFGLPLTQPTDRHAIIVSQIGEQLMGLLVDAVSDILSADDGVIQPTPEVASTLARSFVRGVLALDGRMISIITLENIMPVREREAA